MSYTIILDEGVVIRNQDQKQVAPCDSEPGATLRLLGRSLVTGDSSGRTLPTISTSAQRHTKG